jgi:RNA polymerase sigma-32 factor
MENLALKKTDPDERRRITSDIGVIKPDRYGFDTRDPSSDYYLQIYLLEIRRYDLLTREEEIRLGRRVRDDNDEDALNRLISSNLRLVVKIAKDFRRQWKKNMLDLIQEGNLGLIQAAGKFDPDRGIKFSYYASFWIKAYMLKFIMKDWALVKVGTTQNQRKLFFNLSRERNKMLEEGLAPQPVILAERLGVKESEITDMSRRMEGEISISAPITGNSRETFEDNLKDPGMTSEEQLSREWRKAVFSEKLKEFRKRLPERESDIFDNRIMSEAPIVLRKLAERHGISRERVRQIQNDIIKKIKAWSEKEIPNFEEVYKDL